ncbi:MAG: glycosyltransferase family 4 protein [Deltaproteobacteria bacterium]|uniref:glycosyltransferase family 4 protein n=1 Tax=Desulfobacula sp. TaxID=2593537 RepID=UPI0019B7ABC0|nr:glycosyltransferase family 4 protein [Candidatus Desulfobacula maris]MBL6992767.1 glycosyltransferase family 4 protein [Desulfobacula sp.]
MNILYIWDADYPWDIRVDKITSSLRSVGYNVHIAARNLKGLPKKNEVNGIFIHRLRSYENQRINYFLSFPFFFNPFWLRLLNKIVKENAIELIIVRDLPLAPAGIIIAKIFSLPVIFDMAENYVAFLKEMRMHSKIIGLNLLVRNPFLAKLVEIYVFANTDHSFVVVEEAKNILINAGVNINRISIVSNTPLMSLLENHEKIHIDNVHGELIRNRYSAIYAGGLQKGRGLQTVFEAMPAIIEKIPDFLFVIIGDGYSVDFFKEMVQKKGIEGYVLWVGWVEHNDLYAYIKDSKIGLIPHFVSEHVNTTIPNKLFDYMAMELPVIVTDAVPLARIVQEEKCGFSYKSGDSSDLQRAIVKLHGAELSFGMNGKRAIKRKYNWERDEKELLCAIKLFEKNKSS